MSQTTIRNTLARSLRRQLIIPNVEQDFDIDEDVRGDLLSKEVRDRISDNIRNYVIERTLSGYDYEWERFLPYSKQYAKYKGVNPNDVDLKLTGQMLNDFYVKVKVRPEHDAKDVYFIELKHLSIHYGFKTEFSKDKYFWNADNQYNINRDFLGAHIGVPLMDAKELLKIIDDSISIGSKGGVALATRKGRVIALKEKVNSADSKVKREEIINAFYEIIRSGEEVKIFNNDLQADIYITPESIDETKFHASRNPVSTRAVLELENILKYARKVGSDNPKPNTRRQNPYKEMIILNYYIEDIGEVKLTVGVKKVDNKHIQYCVTAIE